MTLLAALSSLDDPTLTHPNKGLLLAWVKGVHTI